MYLVDYNFLKNEKDVIVIDCRYEMTNPSYGYNEYKKNHLEGAYYLDLDKDLTGEIDKHGGRHPLPDMNGFVRKIASFGIKLNSKILIYDDGEIPMATRVWFMLNFVGIKNVFILKGGYDSLLNNDFNISKEEPSLVYGNDLSYELDESIICSKDYVKKSMNDINSVIIDSRSNERYLGFVEPFDKIAGHIPTSINYFWKDNFENNKIKSENELKERFKCLNKYDELIIHCGSGITGCVNMFLLNEINIKSKLYLGSYSDWISYEDNEIIIKDDKLIKVIS